MQYQLDQRLLYLRFARLESYPSKNAAVIGTIAGVFEQSCDHNSQVKA